MLIEAHAQPVSYTPGSRDRFTINYRKLNGSSDSVSVGLHKTLDQPMHKNCKDRFWSREELRHHSKKKKTLKSTGGCLTR